LYFILFAFLYFSFLSSSFLVSTCSLITSGRMWVRMMSRYVLGYYTAKLLQI